MKNLLLLFLLSILGISHSQAKDLADVVSIKKELFVVQDIIFPPVTSNLYFQEGFNVAVEDIDFDHPYCSIKSKEVFFDRPAIVKASHHLILSIADKRWSYPTEDLAQAKTTLYFYEQDILEINCYQLLSDGFISVEQFTETLGLFVTF